MLSGEIITLGEVATDLEISERSVRYQLKSLEEAGYLRKAFASRGIRIELRLWKWEKGFGGFELEDGPDRPVARQKSVGQQTHSVTKKRNAEDSALPKIVEQERPARQKGVGQDALPSRFMSRGDPPPCIPPLRKKINTVSTTTTLVLLPGGKPEKPVDAVAERQEGRQASPASKELDRNLGRIPEHERPYKTRTIEQAFRGLSLDGINQVFEHVWRERNRSGYLDSPCGWWAKVLVRNAEAWRKIDLKASEWDGVDK